MTNQSNLPQTFNFNNNQVRIIEQGDELWFVAADVCKVLGLTHTSNSLKCLNSDEKGSNWITTLGGVQKMSIISESGLYKLIMRSNKSEAKAFQNWVTGEVLPAIRKAGSYDLQPQPQLALEDGHKKSGPDFDRAASLAAQAAQAVFEAVLTDNKQWLNNARFITLLFCIIFNLFEDHNTIC